MLTLQQTMTKTLETPEDVGNHVHEEYERRLAAAPFRTGDRVRLRERADLRPGIMVGDVGTVLLCDPVASPYSVVLCAHDSGFLIHATVQTVTLEKVA